MIGDSSVRKQPGFRAICVAFAVVVVLAIATVVRLTRSTSILISSGTSSLILRHADSRLEWILAGQPLPSAGSIYVPAGHAAGLVLDETRFIQLAGDTFLTYDESIPLFSLHLGAVSFDTGGTALHVRIPGGEFLLCGSMQVQVSSPDPLRPGAPLQADLVVEKGTAILVPGTAHPDDTPGRSFAEGSAWRFHGSLKEPDIMTKAVKARLQRRLTHSGQNGRLERQPGESVEETLTRTVRHQAMPAAVDAVKAVVRLEVDPLRPALVATLTESGSSGLPAALSSILKQALKENKAAGTRPASKTGRKPGEESAPDGSHEERNSNEHRQTNGQQPGDGNDESNGTHSRQEPRNPDRPGENKNDNDRAPAPKTNPNRPAGAGGANASLASPGTASSAGSAGYRPSSKAGEKSLGQTLTRILAAGEKALKTHDPESIRMLGKEMVENSEPLLRNHAAAQLLGIKTTLSAPFFRELLDGQDEEYVQRGLTYFSSRFLPDPIDPAVEARITELARGATGKSTIQKRALSTLARRVGAKIIPLLRDVLEDGVASNEVKADAVKYLGVLGDDATARFLREHYATFHSRPEIAAAIVNAYGALNQKSSGGQSSTGERPGEPSPHTWLIERLRETDTVIKRSACQALVQHRQGPMDAFTGQDLQALQTFFLEPRPEGDNEIPLRGTLAFHVFQDLPVDMRYGFLGTIIPECKPRELISLLRCLGPRKKPGDHSNIPDNQNRLVAPLLRDLVKHENPLVRLKTLKVLHTLQCDDADVLATCRKELKIALKKDPGCRDESTWLLTLINYQVTGAPELFPLVEAAITGSNVGRISAGLLSLHQALDDRAVPILLDLRDRVASRNRLHIAAFLARHGVPAHHQAAVHQWSKTEDDPDTRLILAIIQAETSRIPALQALEQFEKTLTPAQQTALIRLFEVDSLRALRARLAAPEPLPRTFLEKLANHVVQITR